MTARATLERYHRRLTSELINARSRWSERQGLLLTLVDSHGHFGQGETAPLPGYSEASLDDCHAALARMPADLLETALSVDVPMIGAVLDERRRDLPAEARFALETALLDLRARREGIPLFRLLRTLQKDAPSPVELPLVALISEEPTQFRSAAETAISAGYAGVKLKIGRPGRFDEELTAIAEVRDVLGTERVLRLDANGALPSGALDLLVAAAPEFVEEPFARGGTLPAHPSVPLALYESLRDGLSLTPERIRGHRLVAFVLKLGPLGGFFSALALVRELGAAGSSPVLSHTLEGPVGTAAAMELALALGARQRAPGLAPHSALAAWSEAVLPALFGARLAPHTQPGLGLPRLAA